MDPIKGIDYAWGRPGATTIRNAGYRFVCRYLSHDTSGKNLTPSEANSLASAGLWIVVVWESTASRALAGRAAGVVDAQAASKQAAACGMPSDRPIYFAVDFDATSGQQAAINAYLDGAASVLGRNRVGLYAGYYVIKRAFDAHKISYGWQTYAWSGGHWDARAQLRQYDNGHRLNGVGVDYDQAGHPDYGQWRPGVSPGEESDMDPSTQVKIHPYYANATPDEFSHDTYSAGYLWQGSVYETRAYGQAILKALAALQADHRDVDAIVAGVLAGMEPAKIAELVTANLPPDLAEQVVNEVAARLGGAQPAAVGRHAAGPAAIDPGEMWERPEVNEVASAFWDGVEDFAEDGNLSEAGRERMVRSARTLAQALSAAVLTGAAPAAWNVLHGHPTNIHGAATAFATAAVAAVVAFFHTRKRTR